MLGYRSIYGEWGLSFVITQLAEHASWLHPMDAAFQRFGADLVLALAVLVSWRMNRTPMNGTGTGRPALYAQVGLIFFLMLSVSSGFGVQYLAWVAPWVVELGWIPAAIFYGVSGVFLFLVYNLWAEGLPWYLADGSGNIGGFGGYLDYAQMACWLSVLVLLAVAWKRVGMTTGWKRLLPFAPLEERWRWAVGLATAAALFVLVPPQLPPPPKTGDTFEHAVRQVNSDSYLDLSQRLYYFGRYQDSIEAAHEAMALMPEAAAKAGDYRGR